MLTMFFFCQYYKEFRKRTPLHKCVCLHALYQVYIVRFIADLRQIWDVTSSTV
jgi:hypothetical protein